jgi:cytoplasmic iron level regulating protein YaaA (DUF328/UPF0246 family)
MLVLLSPAKTLDLTPIKPSLEGMCSEPYFSSQASDIASELRKLSSTDIAKLMDLSEPLAKLNHERYQQFNSAKGKAAIFAYKGDVYKNIEVDSYSTEDLKFAQSHILIISGLYGLLRPMDLIKPYRLEMGTKVPYSGHADIQRFWYNILSNKINELLDKSGHKVVLNLASNEYTSSINIPNVKARFINVNFQEERNGTRKTIGLLAKRARGKMADFIIKNRIEEPEQLAQFAAYRLEQSREDEMLFVN